MNLLESVCVTLIFVAMIAALVTAPAWVDAVDNLECKSTPTMERKKVEL